MGIVSNQNSCSDKLSLLLVALAFVMGFQPGLAEDREIEQLRKAAGQGDAGAQLHMGLRYYTGAGVTQDSKEAVEWLRKSGGQGNTLAQYELSQIWSSDESVPLDREDGLRWLHKAAEGGHAEAQSELGDKYRIRSLTQCEEESRETAKVMLKWYRKAAKQGASDPMERLGDMYASGKGVPKDTVKAYAWYILLCRVRSGKQVIEKRDRYRESMTAEQVAEAQKVAAEFWECVKAEGCGC